MGCVIGLTGGIASGKSLVSGMLKELGGQIIDADLISRQVVEPGKPAWQQIVKEFGEGIINEDQTIKRKKLGSIVFADPDQLDKLNKITHPYITEEIEELLEEYRESGQGGVMVLDAPLLLELGMERLVDQVWVVAVDYDTQLERLMKRDNLSAEEAKCHIQAQMPLEKKIKRADRVIDNHFTLNETKQQVEEFWQEIALGR
ncbi:MAG: dephospho-CoA kinase [Syntrophaceticus sp.]|nr:dephospho-CoA kinase [Syntrophaceticus sp.]MDD3314720.1 dephospho-CoA kinase [Syntrophaceticus sp.]MDD4782902.1 dephospho-CoA kinase [Syntrophaceticus sp.]